MMAKVSHLFLFYGLLVATPPVLALTPNLPAGSLGRGMVVQTRLGPFNCIIEAPRPRIAPIHGRAHGVYAADINVATGDVYTARVLESSGDPTLDNAMLEALQKWRFRPRIIYKLVVPVDFRGSTVYLGGR